MNDSAGREHQASRICPRCRDGCPNGNYPAIEYARAVTARDVITARRRLGISQAELARRAGIRGETLNRIERAKLTPSVAVMQRSIEL